MRFRRLDNSFTRFLLVGVLNTIVGLCAMYFFLNLAGFNYWASTFLGNSIGAVVSYVLNKTFTFRHKGTVRSSAWKFVLVILVCYGLSYWTSLQLSSLLQNALPLSQKVIENIAVLVGAGIYTIANYLGNKFFAFRHPGEEV
ncbi:GtrA family protein [Effusibacillus lacus]|uniref:GtrA family protein n=1 Tax=Effusibacillus lacus TaxID=1348429 RepID=A0A292YU99_9BACL|nr:GtrA family protein [Effusibacillus lacus]TCS73765.1 putative flippase GtrA [Effusibacillus lacus]GAX92024.1 GtrA family protein [Effusibacillus lacus]